MYYEETEQKGKPAKDPKQVQGVQIPQGSGPMPAMRQNDARRLLREGDKIMKPIIAALLINHAPIETQIIRDVATEYGLTDEQTQLLAVIRIIENGRDGVEYGIEKKQAMRYKGNKVKSLRLQAQWCAGTIKKRYTGDLQAFAKRYCAVNADVWYKNAKFFMNKS